MLPIWPEIARFPADEALASVAFGTMVPVRAFGDENLEVWRSNLPVKRAVIGDVETASNGMVMFGSLAGSAANTEAITSWTYEKILAAARSAGYPHLLRIWNHIGGINGCEDTLERYRRFCIGRHDALTRNGYAGRLFPAASAVGMPSSGLVVYFLASRTSGIQIENPRQVAAYDYPPAYGPRSPSFSRATVAAFGDDAMVFVSGTSSVVGSETRHPGDIEAQVEETLRNLDRIVREAGASLDAPAYLKTYIRRAADYEVVRRRVDDALPHARGLFLEADICRRDLLVEIEAVCVKRSLGPR